MAYGSFIKKHERQITLAGCWAHVRRNFYEAREQAPQRCGWIFRQIGHLYRIEENLRRSEAGPRNRAAVRLSQSRPICQRLCRALVLFKASTARVCLGIGDGMFACSGDFLIIGTTMTSLN